MIALAGTALRAQDANVPTQSTVYTLDAGSTVHLRLREPLSTFSAKQDEPVVAQVVEPVMKDGTILIPTGTELLGTVSKVRRVGLGLSREQALIRLSFSTIRFGANDEQPAQLRIVMLDNSRETVDPDGTIRGIRATASASKMLSGAAISAASLDPMSLLFGLSASLSAFRMPESEIVMPAGTELTAVLDAPVDTHTAYDEPPPTSVEPDALASFVHDSPWRTRTKGKNQPSDITTIAMIGDGVAITRALAAAGWVQARPLGAAANYGVVRSVVENQGFQEGPVSTLLLDGKAPVSAWSKTLDTFFQRDHLRLFATSSTLADSTVFVASATHDSGIGVNWTSKSMIHLVDENIDAERQKIAADMMLTGCVTGVSYVDRPWIPAELQNATGDSLQTDRRMLVLQFNHCDQPALSTATVTAPRSDKASPPVRFMRDGVLFLRDDLSRGNIVYQGYQGTRMGLTALRNHNAPKSGAAPASMNVAGQKYTIVRRANHPSEPLPPSLESFDDEDQAEEEPPSPVRRDYRSSIGYSVSGGYSWFGNSFFSSQQINYPTASGTSFPLFAFDDKLGKGWVIAPKVTLNSWKYISNEFGYTYNVAPLTLQPHFLIPISDVDPDVTAPLVDGGQLRQFTYNALFHLRPNGSRLRPYAAIGPSFQLLRLVDSEPSKNELLSVSVRDVSLLVGAYNFGKTSPLEGGGIFQIGLQYGGGVQYYLTRHVFLRTDFRETISPQPRYWAGTQKDLQPILDEDLPGATVGKEVIGNLLRHRNTTMGFGFSF